jgi:hypothetical protein
VTISDIELEAGLRDLRGRADHLTPHPADLVQRTRERYRAQRRTRTAMAAGGLLALVLFVGVPVAASTFAADPQRGQTATPSSGRTFTPSTPTGLYALPTRGDLAADEEWLAAVTALDWGPVDTSSYPAGMEVPDPSVGSRRVAFAGDVPSGRVALVLGMDGQYLAHAWFVGPTGAGPGEMTLATAPAIAGADEALALVDAPTPDADPVTLLVVAVPGDDISRAETPVVDASGHERIEREQLPVEDGIGVTTVPAPWPWGGWAGEVMIEGPGHPSLMSLDASDRLTAGRTGGGLWTPITPADPRGLLDRTRPEQAEGTAGSVLAGYGLTAEQAEPTLLAVGPLGQYVGTYGELYGFTFPSGAVGTWVMTYPPGRSDAGSQMFHLAHLPAGEPLMERVIAVRAAAGLLVSAPARGTRAEAIDSAGTVLAVIPLERGAGTGPSNDSRAVTVRILDDEGNVVGEGPIRGIGG